VPQQLTPNYTAPLKLFRNGRHLINFRGAVERRENHGASYGHVLDQADSASSFYSQSSNTKGVMYCRVFAIAVSVTKHKFLLWDDSSAANWRTCLFNTPAVDDFVGAP